jgi:hypothetical protein
MSSCLGSNSAEGAAFNSRGREAVDSTPREEIEARRAGISLHCDRGFTAAPAALDYLGFD